MNNLPLVSVIMPVYNSEKYLNEAIQSILNQTYENIELIIIDDCSTDFSKEIIKNINSEKINFIKNEKNMGVSFTRNLGFKLAKGKYIALMDADDISLPTRIKMQVEFLEKNKEFGLVSGHFESFKKYLYLEKKSIRKVILNSEYIKANLLFTNSVCGGCAMIRKDIILNNDIYFDTSLIMAEDFDLWRRINKITKIGNIDMVLLRYRKHGNNSTKNRIILDKNYIEVVQKSFDDFNINISELFDKKFKLKDINSFLVLNKKLELIIKSNYKTKIYNQIFLEKSCANLLLWIYKKHVNKFGYKLFIELEKVMLSKYVKISNNDKIKIYLNSLFGKKI